MTNHTCNAVSQYVRFMPLQIGNAGFTCFTRYRKTDKSDLRLFHKWGLSAGQHPRDTFVSTHPRGPHMDKGTQAQACSRYEPWAVSRIPKVLWV